MHIEPALGRLTDAQTGATFEPAQLAGAIALRSAFLRDMGLAAGDRVLVHHGNSPAFFVDLLAIWRSGGCAVPLDTRATATEITNILAVTGARLSLWDEPPGDGLAGLVGAAGARLLTTADGVGARVRSAAGFGLDDDALILFTSGTTGQPKGVVHTHRSLRARWSALRAALGTQAFARTLCLLPTHFGHGLICNCLFPWLSGQQLVVMPPFRPDLLLGLGEIIDRHAITFMSSVPPVWRIALKMTRPPRGRTLQRVFCGSAPLSRHLWEAIAGWTGAEVGNAYGITETGSWVGGSAGAGLPPEDGLVGPGWGTMVRVLRRGDTADGPPEPGDECFAGEEGFVWLNTPGLMRGYLGRADLTAAVVTGGWFSTGDIGVLDGRGMLYLRGRQREEINRGGMKLFPADMDAVIERFAGVADVCSFPVEDPLYGENIGIAVVAADRGMLDLPGLYRWATGELGAHRLPARWYLLEEIPRTSRGKINRALVAEVCAGREPLSLQQLTGA